MTNNVLASPNPSHQKNGDGGRPESRSLHSYLGTQATGPARWVLALVIFSAVMGASLGLAGVLQDMAWLPQAAVVVAGTLLFPALMRRYSALSPAAPLGALVGWFMVLTLMFFPGTAVLGVIPTPGTLSSALDLASDASNLIMTNLAPVPSASPMHFLFCAGLGFAALLIDALAITVALPAASFMGLLLILLPAALTTRTGISTPGLVGTASGFLLILACCRWYVPDGKLRTDMPKAPSGTLTKALVMGASVVLLMQFVTAALPGFTEGRYPQGSALNATGEGGSLDAMVTLGDDLRSQSERVVLRYTTSAEEPEYLRLTTLENFKGKVWGPSALPSNLQAKLSRLSPAIGPSSGLPKTKTVTRITVPGVGDEWLPAPLTVTDVQQLPGVWLWNPSTATIVSQTSTTAGQSYVVRSEMPVLTPDLLNQATAAPRKELDPVFLALPSDVPSIVNRTVTDLTSTAVSPYAKAIAIQNYFQSDEFSYSLSAPVADGYDGSGMGVLADFLVNKKGYCVHFSAAMAVMAREVGIPSRIAVGYTAGTRTPGLDKQEENLQMRGFEVAGRDAHAWPELYFEGLGWVPFEPTPSRGDVPAYAQEDSVPTPAPQSQAATTEQPSTAASTATTSVSATALSGTGTAVDNSGRWLAGMGWVLLILAALASPALLRSAIRRRRLAKIHDPRDTVSPEVRAWRELQDSATDFGYRQDPAHTPALAAQQFAAMLGPTTPSGLTLLLHAYEEAIYGAGLSKTRRDDLADAVQSVTARLRTQSTLMGRMRALLMPASLIRRTDTNAS
ncbi:DUF3488 and transglutaminase-like domain-containing protein [Arthrobacter sp. lap29]|uniref:transglutaminase family protein n=1 Tax=Arthrobacter sp. lap29 TaxID=3056122 RepID=UPI0028F6F033|nr:DUF3488 and transglutaminase-like domain-containing protein [Arthrobacter sp. lap29]